MHRCAVPWVITRVGLVGRGDLAQRARQAERVSGELGAAGIGEVLARARDREDQQLPQKRGEHGEHHPQQEEDQHQPAAAARSRASRAGSSGRRPVEAAARDVREQHGRAEERGDQRHRADVEVSHV
jgi:hypothetical protein